MPKTLHDRGDALEQAFFSKMDAKLLDDLRQKKAAEQSRAALQKVSGITDPAALDALIKLGISPDTLSAMALIPLLHVAWGDNSLDDSERDAVLVAMHDRGVHDGSDTYKLLSSWLTAEPKPELFAAWKSYVLELRLHLDADSYAVMKSRVLEDCGVVSRASGGMFGIGAVSSSERNAIAEITKVLEG